MTAESIQSPHLSRLLRRIRNRLWQRSAVNRLTVGCYQSAGIALVLAAVHLLVISVPALIWWVAVALPLVGRLPGTLVTDRPDAVTSAKFADSWFATRELFTAAQYVNQMPASHRFENVSQQISNSAETAATQLLANNAPRPRFGTDPRITLAVLFIALSALLTLPAATSTATASQTDLEGPPANKPIDVDTTSWLVKSAPEAAPDQIDSSGNASDRDRNERMSGASDPARQQQIYQPIPAEMLAAADEALPEMAHTTAPSNHNPASSTRPGDPKIDSPGTSLETPATGLDAPQRSQPREQIIADTPTSTQTNPVLLDHRASQVTAQAGPRSPTDRAAQTNARPAQGDQLGVVADPPSRPVEVDTTDLAQQQWGPNARTLAARYAQARQP